jgi:hypothetical protein
MTTISNLPRVTSIGSNSLFLVVENGISKVVTWSFIENNIKGAQGFRGSSGFIGSRGPIGFTGSSSGFVGSRGEKGDIGSPGGFIGSRGYTGSIGFTGSRGVVGSQGFTGSQGAGFVGSQGLGATGFVGSLGFVGSVGVGFVGSRGQKGDPGDPGGYTGSSGAAAAQGFTGSSGSGSGSGFLGSRGFVGSVGFVGSGGIVGFTGSSGTGGGSGLSTRIAASSTTGSLTANQSANLTITGYKSYALLKVQTNSAAWVRIYTNAAYRTADASRTQGTDPAPGSGVIAEVITIGATTQIITPGAIGWNDDSPASSSVYVAVTNLSGVTQTITVTLTMLQLEE